MQIEDKMVNLAPGMVVTVEIKTGTRRLIEYLMCRYCVIGMRVCGRDERGLG
jgi:hypothetical protein